jgi:hypothetical protein
VELRVVRQRALVERLGTSMATRLLGWLSFS